MSQSIERYPRGERAGSDREAAETAPGWHRHDTQAQLAPTYRPKAGDPPRVLRQLEGGMLKKAKSRAHLIVASSIDLYRELTLSALSLVRR